MTLLFVNIVPSLSVPTFKQLSVVGYVFRTSALSGFFFVLKDQHTPGELCNLPRSD